MNDVLPGHDGPAPRPPDDSRLPLSQVAADIGKIEEEFPSFTAAFNRTEFLSLASKIHGGFTVSEPATATEDVDVGGNLLGTGEMEPVVEGEAAFFRVSGSQAATRVSAANMVTSHPAADGGLVTSGGGALPHGANPRAALSRVSKEGGTRVAVDDVVRGGGGLSAPPPPAAQPASSKFLNIRTTPVLSRVRRLPQRGTFIPSGGEDSVSVAADGLGLAEGGVSGVGGGQLSSEKPLPPAASPERTGTVLSDMDGGSIRFGSLDFKFSSQDAFASSFIKSNRTCLRYVAPEFVDGQAVVRPSWSLVEQGQNRWRFVLVGYFLGRKLPFYDVKSFVESIWKGVVSVRANSNGFFFFEFSSEALLLSALEGGPWMVMGQPLFLERWREGMSLCRKVHKVVPVWVKLRGIPLEYWTTEGLSVVASAVGRPLYPDVFTRDCLRIDYARVCIMMEVDSPFRDHFFIVLPSPTGEYVGSCRVEVEYEWKPLRCSVCNSFGHNGGSCPTRSVPKVQKPVRIYVSKNLHEEGWQKVNGKRKGVAGSGSHQTEILPPSDSSPPEGPSVPCSNGYDVLADSDGDDTGWIDKGSALVVFRGESAGPVVGKEPSGLAHRVETGGVPSVCSEPRASDLEVEGLLRGPIHAAPGLLGR